MRDPFAAEHCGKKLGNFNRDRADEDRLSFRMRFLHSSDDRAEFLGARLINRVIEVFTGDRNVRRNLDYIHSVDIPEFCFFRQCCTGHTAFLIKFIKEVLERDCRERFRFAVDLHVLLRFNGLVQTVTVAAARHDTAGKFVNDEDFIILNDIVLITVHDIVCAERELHIMLDFEVFRVCVVLEVEVLFHLRDAVRRHRDVLFFFIDHEIAGFLLAFAHQDVELRRFDDVLAALHALRERIADFIELSRFSGLAGNDQRRTRFIDEDGVHLIDDRVIQATEHQLTLVDDHIVS